MGLRAEGEAGEAWLGEAGESQSWKCGGWGGRAPPPHTPWAQRGGSHGPWGDPAVIPGASPPDVCPRGRGDGQALWDGANPGETPISGPVTPDPNTPRVLVSGLLLFQHLDLLVHDSSHSSKAGLGCMGDIIQVRGAEGGHGPGVGASGQKGRGGGRGPEGEPRTGAWS